MAYDATLPLDTGYLAEAPAELREQYRALLEDMIVNAGKLKGYEPGNASGNIPLNNGTLNTNLNADLLDGHDSAYFSAATHSHSTATTDAAGLMSSADKTKLNGIATGAEVNQNAFSNVKVGSSTIQADGKTDTLELAAGNYIGLTADTTNDKVTIGVAWPKVAANGYTDIISLYDADATSNRAGTIRITNGNGFHEMLLGVHNESNGAPNGLIIKNTNGTFTSNLTGTLTVGGLKIGTSTIGSATQPVYVNAGTITAGTYELNKTVPSDAKFTDTVYTHPSYTARTGKPTANQTPSFGGTFTVSQITSDASGHVTAATDKTVTIPATAMTGASSSAAGAKGLVPAPAKGAQNYYLRGDGTWQANLAGSAAKLTTARSLYVKLNSAYDSESPVTFDGSAAKALPVTGTLPIANGGTGNTTGKAATATKLATARNISVKCRTGTASASFDGSAAITIDISSYT